MDGAFKKPKKRQREEHGCYLLATSSTWIVDEALPRNSALMVASYNDSLQFEQTYIKDEPEKKIFDTMSMDAFVLPRDARNKSAVKIEKDAEPLLSIKLEEDCEEGNGINQKDNTSLIGTEENADSMIGTELEDHSESESREDMNDMTVSNSLSSVYGHIKTVDGVVYYKCDFCAKLFNFRCDIAVHRRSHTKERIFKCNRCVKSFVAKSNLIRHINIVHKKHELAAKCADGRFNCDKCNKTYSTSCGFKGHICKTFKCVKCNEKYSTLGILKAHTCNSVSEVKVSRCENCKKEFKKEERLLRHINFECYYIALEALKTSKLGVPKACK